jgi:hypothetical protein
MEQLRRQVGPRGVEEDSERTYVEVQTIREILGSDVVDWSSLGMILGSFFA